MGTGGDGTKMLQGWN